LAVARACGADLCLNPNHVDVVDEVRKLTEGYGCDIYIEATGQPSGVQQGLQMIRRLGTFVEFSVLRELVSADWTIIGDTKELDIRGSHLGPYCYPIAIDMLAKGLLPMDQIVTHQLPLASFQDGINMVGQGDVSIKVALVP
jgi:erythritol/L-threitol dehydrogenase